MTIALDSFNDNIKKLKKEEKKIEEPVEEVKKGQPKKQEKVEQVVQELEPIIKLDDKIPLKDRYEKLNEYIINQHKLVYDKQ